jgi:hypothetical protein
MNPAITELRLELKRAGYSPVPIVGKIPPVNGWTTMADSEDAIRAWPTAHRWASNTGLRTRYTPGVDADITDIAASREIYHLTREFFGNPPTRIGRAPKFAILLRAEEPMKKTSLALRGPDGSDHQIEVLGDGQQLASFGVHPETKQPYRWQGVEPGAAAPRGSLPLLTPEITERFLKAAGEVLERKLGWRVRAGGTVNRKRKPQEWQEIVREGAGVNLRHPTILSLAGHLLARGIDPGVTLELMQAFNLARCRPPKSEQEVYEIVNWCAGRELADEGGEND